MGNPNANAIVFDFDDTLIDTTALYYNCQKAFFDYVGSKTKLLPEMIVKLFEEQDAEDITVFGYVPWRYTYSMLQIYLNLARESELAFETDDVLGIVQIGRQIESSIPSKRFGADEVLNRLSESYRLVLLTRGVEKLQKYKLEQCGWTKLFEHILVVNKKETKTFSDLLSLLSLPANRVWSIGDSPIHDIIPARTVGLNAIMVSYSHPEYSWKHEGRKVALPDDVVKVDNLYDILPILL